MSKVLVIDINKKPQNPIHPSQARQLLRNKKAAIRATGSFNISTIKGLVEGVSYKYCKAIHRKDGYGYQ